MSKSPKKKVARTPVKFEIPPTVKLFENTNLNPMTFRVITAITIFQLPVWLYLSHYAITEFKLSQKEEKKQETKTDEGAVLGATMEEELNCNAREDVVPFAFHQEMLEDKLEEKSEDKSGELTGGRVATEEAGESKDSSKWRISLSLLSLSAGLLFTLMVYIYPRRVVRSVIYLRPSHTLQLTTYTSQGVTRTLDVLLADVTCRTNSTEQARGQNVALKVKGHPMYFLLNMTNAHVDPLLRTLVLNQQATVKAS